MANNTYRDGFGSLLDGMNSGLAAEHLPASQYARGINIQNRKGVAKTRATFSLYPFTDADAGNGVWRGGYRYRLNDHEYVVWVVSGNIWMLDLTTGTLTDITGTTGIAMAGANLPVYFCKAEKYCILQDGVNMPVILDGATARLADHTNSEVPIGTIMAYGHGRLFLVPAAVGTQDGRRFFLAGDICLPNDPATLLRFTETEYWAGGGAMALPNEFGFITGLAFQRNANTGTGYGPLIAFARNGVSAFAVNLPRVQSTTLGIPGWQGQDISQVLFMDWGTVSPFSLLPLNSDLLFRGLDGERSISLTVNEGGSTLRNQAMSGEMQEVFLLDDSAHLFYASQAFADNRLNMTVVPSGDSGWAGLATMDFAPVDNVKQRSPPAFDGVITGAVFKWVFSALYNGKDRIFAFVERGGRVDLVLQDDAGTTDPYDSPTESRLYTRMMTFFDSSGRNAATTRKALSSAVVWLSEIEGECEVSLYCKSDYFPYWTKMGDTATFNAPVGAGGAAQQRLAVNFAPANQLTDPVGGGNGYVGYGFQFALVWKGKLAVNRLLAEASEAAAVSKSPCSAANEGVELTLASATDAIDLEATDYSYRW